MKTTTRRATVLVAVGVLGLGGLAVAAPAIAGVGASGQPTAAASEPVPGWPGGSGMGPGSGMGSPATAWDPATAWALPAGRGWAPPTATAAAA